jgi:hypothetical protein
MIRKIIQHILITFLFAAVVLALPVGSAFGADIQIEVFYLPHRPAMEVVSKVENVAAEFNIIDLKKYSFDDPGAEKLLKQYDLREHMPVAIFINGENSFTVNGQMIRLRNFPKGEAFVPMFAGEWDYADLRAILQEMSGGK